MDAEYLADQLADDLDYVDDTALEWIDLEIERLRRAVARAYADGVRRALYGEVDRRSARTAVAAAAELKYWRAVRAEVARRRPW